MPKKRPKKTTKKPLKPTKAKIVKPRVLPAKEYAKTLAELKHQIQEARLKAIAAVNTELIKVYWGIGKTISEKEKRSEWGAKVIQRLSKDLLAEFPDMKGFSPRNLLYMRQFYDAYPDIEITKQPVAQIPWGHNIVLFQKVENAKERLWYAKKTIEHGWSRNVLNVWIENDLYNREGKALTNFKKALPAPQSDLAQQSTKDPYILDFLALDIGFKERELELGLIDNIQRLLLEFGHGFAFIGRQHRLEVDGKEFFVDLLFYNYILHCYVAVDLKIDEFKPEYAGKMNFYLGAIDRLMKSDIENPSIGLILCKSKSKVQVEITLQDIKKPIAVSDYVVAIKKGVPKEFISSLPTIEEIEYELDKGN